MSDVTIPTPRVSPTPKTITGRYMSAYLVALDDMRRWEHRKDRRSASLRAYYEKQRKDEVTITHLIDQDQLVREAQILLDRATAKAAALGPAALLEAQGLMR